MEELCLCLLDEAVTLISGSYFVNRRRHDRKERRVLKLGGMVSSSSVTWKLKASKGPDRRGNLYFLLFCGVKGTAGGEPSYRTTRRRWRLGLYKVPLVSVACEQRTVGQPGELLLVGQSTSLHFIIINLDSFVRQ